MPNLLDPWDIAGFRNDPRLPELARLSIKQRQWVWKNCAQPYLTRRRILLTAFAGTLLSVSLAFTIRAFVNLGPEVTAIIMCLGVALNTHFWLGYCRRRIRTFISENGPALEAAEKESWLRMPSKPPS